MKLRRVHPTVWIQRVIERNENTLENRILQTPSLSVHNKNKSVSDLNSKCYYKLIFILTVIRSIQAIAAYSAWENEFEVDIDWPKVYKRYFIYMYTKENKSNVNSTSNYCITCCQYENKIFQNGVL